MKKGFFFEVISKTSDGKVLLTFDDGPDEKFTPLILDILQKENVRAVFFCIGKNMKGHPSIVKRIISEGHTLGNHSFSHNYWIDFGSKRSWEKEIGATNSIAGSIVGKKLRLFRPPYGVCTPNIKPVLEASNMSTIGWSLRSYDTTIKKENRLSKRIISLVRPGDIILLHDTQLVTVKSLTDIIRGVRMKGYEFGNFEQSITTHAYA